MKRRIVINASTVKISGGLYVALDIIEAFIKQDDLEIKIICPDIPSFRKFCGRATVGFVPGRLFHYINRPILDLFWLPREINSFDPEMVLSLSNLPARTRKYQVFLHDNAFMSQLRFSGLHLTSQNILVHRLRRMIFVNRIRFIDRIVTQTELEKSKLIVQVKNIPEVVVQAPLLTMHLNSIRVDGTEDVRDTGLKRIACLSRYFDHKNLEILYRAAALCAEKQLPYQFILTIEYDQERGARRLIKTIEEENCGHHIINHGKVPRKRIVEFIRQVDAIILPSLLESYSLNYLEAWYLEKPIFISDRPFAREVCREAAGYFDPEDPASLITCIEKGFSDSKELNRRIRKGKEILQSLPSQEKAVRIFLGNFKSAAE